MQKVLICVAVLSVLILPINAEVVEVDNTYVSFSVFVPCANGGNGEIVDLNGNMHTVISVTINDNNVSGFSMTQPQGISGSGETTGAKYQATGTAHGVFKSSLQNGQANETSVFKLSFIGQGPGNNFSFFDLEHYTFNADGRVTVVHEYSRATCK